MTFVEYLESMFGEQKTMELRAAIRSGKAIVIKGPAGPTGKTTLRRVLEKVEAPAFEERDLYEITVQKPLEKLTPRMEELISF